MWCNRPSASVQIGQDSSRLAYPAVRARHALFNEHRDHGNSRADESQPARLSASLPRPGLR
jgi:hypothetical protein